MLALDRKPGEKIQIGTGADRITIELVKFHRGRARIAINAPRHIPIVRTELLERDAAAEEAAA